MFSHKCEICELDDADHSHEYYRGHYFCYVCKKLIEIKMEDEIEKFVQGIIVSTIKKVKVERLRKKLAEAEAALDALDESD
jgi:hypothetical protein